MNKNARMNNQIKFQRVKFPEGGKILIGCFIFAFFGLISQRESAGLGYFRDVPLPGLSVDGHFLFETIVNTIVDAGDEIVRMKNKDQLVVQDASSASSSGQFFGKYPDGSKELHTRADTASHKLIGRVRDVFPGIAIVDEEDSTGEWRKPLPRERGIPQTKNIEKDDIISASRLLNLRGKSSLPLTELAIYVDPLDATLEYSEGLTEFVSVSACVTRCGKPIAGVVYFPFSKRIYWSRSLSEVHVNFDAQTAISAERSILSEWELEGKISTANSNFCCDNRKPKNQASLFDRNSPLEAIQEWDRGVRVIGSRSRKSHNTSNTNVVDLIDSLVMQRRKEDISGNKALDATFLTAGGAAYKLVELVEGRADVYLHPNKIRKWDLCASEVLLRSKGGKISSWDANEIDYCLYEPRNEQTEDDMNQFVVDGVVAAFGPQLHSDIFKGIYKNNDIQ
jgi:fructose-1,6-bisphosphatase/inositol monophosphatase family enzyme